MNELIGLTILATLIRVIELCRNLMLIEGDARRISVRDAYEILNVHGALSLGLYGFILTQKQPASVQVFYICAIIGGALSKGVLSTHNPARLRVSDWDCFFGVYIPNIISGGLLAYTLSIPIVAP